MDADINPKVGLGNQSHAEVPKPRRLGEVRGMEGWGVRGARPEGERKACM